MGYRDPEQQREYQRQWVARRRAKWFAENGPCVRCRSHEDLQLDHKDPSKKVSHRIWSWSWDRIAEEVAKCQVLCGECHAEKSRGEHAAPERISEIMKERAVRGEDHARAYLSDAQVEEIRQRVGSGESQTAVAEAFDVDRRTVWTLVHRTRKARTGS